ncbi:unnamed protein product, partial [Polarella glacialis]
AECSSAARSLSIPEETLPARSRDPRLMHWACEAENIGLGCSNSRCGFLSYSPYNSTLPTERERASLCDCPKAAAAPELDAQLFALSWSGEANDVDLYIKAADWSLSSWSWKDEAKGTKHFGDVAQGFGPEFATTASKVAL